MKHLTILLMLCMGITAFAQINFEPGYFITTQGTKTECLIKNVAWKNNPASFEYKADENGTVQSAGLSTTQEFGVAGYKFEKHAVAIDRTSFETGSLGIKKDPTFTNETLFLKVLTQGPATLYEYIDGNLMRYFYSVDGKPVEQLVYMEYKDGAAIKYNFMFRQQLYNAMLGKIADKSSFDIKYKKDPLVKLFMQYNGNEGTTANYADSNNKTILNFRFTPGVNFVTFDAKRTASPDDIVSNFDGKATFRIGLEAELILPVNNNKWALFTDVHYSKYADSYSSNSNGISQKWSVDYNYLEVLAGLRYYMFLNDTSKIFLNAGYAIAATSNGELNLEYSSPFSTFSNNPDFALVSNAAAGLGYSYSNFSIEARYNFKRNILQKHIAWTGNFSSIGLILGYKFL